MAYDTSELYKIAIEKEARTTFIDGEIRTKNGTTIAISNDMLEPGRLYITNQCVNRDVFEFGSVFCAELGITLKSEIDRYSLYDADIKLNYNILVVDRLDEQRWEKIPLGQYTVNEPTRTGRNVSIKAYDNMVKFDDDLFESITGTPYELITYCCSRCNVSFSQTRADIERLANGTILLSVSIDKVKTYRDLLSYIGQVTCSFATIDRTGKLKMVEFQTEPSREINIKTRVSSKFSDFETHFSSIKGAFIYNDDYKDYLQAYEGDGLEYDMGEVPIVQGLDSTNQAVISNALLKLDALRYVPCDFTFNGDPTIELGDMIVNTDRQGNEIRSIVTFYKWTYRGSHKIKSAGQNPKILKSKNKTAAQFSSLRSDISSKDMAVYTHTNAGKVEVQGGDSSDVTSMNSIASISFAAKKVATCMVMVTIPINAVDDTDVEFHQLFDGIEMLGGMIAQRCHKGTSTITFVNYFSTRADTIHRYSIVGITKGFDGSEPALISVEPYTLKAIIFGQGLSTVVQWDGNVIVNDSIPGFNFVSNNITATLGISDSVQTSKAQYNPKLVLDRVRMLSFESNEVSIKDVRDELTIS